MLCRRCMRSVMTKNWHQLFLGVLILMTTTSGCATGRMTEMRIPGNPNLNDYAIVFKRERGVLESGTFSYGPEGSTIRKLGNRGRSGWKLGNRGRSGYKLFFDLTLDFKYKNGRKYHEKIDIRPLIQKMVEQHKIFDLSKTRWGGYTSLIIKIEPNRLAIDYEVREYIREENPKRFFSKGHLYPVFEKTLD